MMIVSVSIISSMTVFALARGCARLLETMCDLTRDCLVYATTLHVSPCLCLGKWVSHIGLAVAPICGSPVGSVSEWRVAMVLNQGSCIRMMSYSSPFCKSACVWWLDQCTFTDIACRRRSVIGEWPPAGEQQILGGQG